ncbi:MAG: peptide deformylase [Candidatus Latescibacteria bacterium]|nr:peptide deformylase [Candidatus Latescibacterota bacterium]
MSDEIERIRIYGDPVLRKKAEEVTEFDGNLEDLANCMTETMFANESGIALAAPQIGVSRRVEIIDLTFGKEFDNVLTLVNPEILETGDEEVIEEGCLSFPGIFEDIVRPKKIHVRYQDLNGDVKELETDTFLSRVIQHETDHLDGILFVDRLSSVKRAMLDKKLRILAKEGVIE